MSIKQYSLSQLGWKPYFNQQLSIELLETTAPYRVAQVFRNRLVLWGEEGQLDISLAQYPSLQTCTVGDWLLIENKAQIAPVQLERFSLFERKSPRTNTEQLIASNVDTAFIVSSCNHDFNLSRIERYLALAKEAQVEAVLVLTKGDLINKETLYTYLDQLKELETHLSVQWVNALDARDCSQLDDWCQTGQSIVLLGSSGVGKTTLTNTLCGVEQRTADIRQEDSKGKHTTTSRSFFFTSTGGLILDCPGMRELQLTNCEEGVKAVFDDIQQLGQACKFADCQHQNEPKCAVQGAIKAGQLEPRRLINFQKMLREQARNTRSLAESHQKAREFGKLIKGSLQDKKQRRGT